MESKLSVTLTKKRQDKFTDFFMDCPVLGIVAHSYLQETAFINFNNEINKKYAELRKLEADNALNVHTEMQLQLIREWLGV